MVNEDIEDYLRYSTDDISQGNAADLCPRRTNKRMRTENIILRQ